MGIDFYDPNHMPGVHVARYESRHAVPELYFPRWLFESGDSMMSDESFARTCNMSFDDYKLKMFEYGAVEHRTGMYFQTWLQCKKFIDEVIQPSVLMDEIVRKRA